MGDIQNLICVIEMARSKHLAGSDCETSVKTKASELSGENSVIPLISVFCSKSLACSR